MPSSVRDPIRVLVAGGGVAGLEAVLALQALAGDRVRVELLAPDHHFTYRAVSVTEPFAPGRMLRFPLAAIAAARGVRIHSDELARVRPDDHAVDTRDGRQVGYDALVLALGARMTEGVRGALTFRGAQDAPQVAELVAALRERTVRRVAFVVPAGTAWTLPIYELAAQTAAAVRGVSPAPELTVVTPEPAPLAGFGAAAGAMVAGLLAQRGVGVRTASRAEEVVHGELALDRGGSLFVDRVIALPRLVGPRPHGVPCDPMGFVEVDEYTRVLGLADVYAIGDVAAQGVKQGGLAAQQADVAAGLIAAAAGAELEPRAFAPALRGLLLTGDGARFLRRDADRPAEAPEIPPWWPPAKVFGRHLGPFLTSRLDLAAPNLSVRSTRRQSTESTTGAPMKIVIAGGGIAGLEALLALHDMAGERVQLTLIAPDPDYSHRPLAVAEPFALGHADRVPLRRFTDATGAELINDAVTAVDDDAGRVRLRGGDDVTFDALILAPGALAVAGVEGATTWWPGGDPGIYGGLLRDIEEGYTKDVAIVVPAGAVWPLPAYELALMTAGEAWAMGQDDRRVTVVTPEPAPLATFGDRASAALAVELDSAGVEVRTGVVAHVEPGGLALEPTGERIDVERVFAVPRLVGPGLEGVPSDADGFILAGDDGRVQGCERTWAAGDGIVSAVKFGGIATYHARRAAASIARLAGAEDVPDAGEPVLHGHLLVGMRSRRLAPRGDAPGAPLWWPAGKVAGEYLPRWLAEHGLAPQAVHAPPRGAIAVSR